MPAFFGGCAAAVSLPNKSFFGLCLTSSDQ
jgi:hypothetical protein